MRKSGLILPTIKQRKIQYLLHVVFRKKLHRWKYFYGREPDDGAYFSFHKSKQPQPCSKKGVIWVDLIEKRMINTAEQWAIYQTLPFWSFFKKFLLIWILSEK